MTRRRRRTLPSRRIGWSRVGRWCASMRRRVQMGYCGGSVLAHGFWVPRRGPRSAALCGTQRAMSRRSLMWTVAWPLAYLSETRAPRRGCGRLQARRRGVRRKRRPPRKASEVRISAVLRTRTSWRALPRGSDARPVWMGRRRRLARTCQSSRESPSTMPIRAMLRGRPCCVDLQLRSPRTAVRLGRRAIRERTCRCFQGLRWMRMARGLFGRNRMPSHRRQRLRGALFGARLRPRRRRPILMTRRCLSSLE